MIELIQAKEANELSMYNRREKHNEQEEVKKLTLKEQVAYYINEAISKGKTKESFSSRTEVGKWIRDNKDELKDLGYKLSFFMGKSTIGDVRIEWEDVK